MTAKSIEALVYLIDEKIMSYPEGSWWTNKDCNDYRQAKKELIEDNK